MHYCGRHHGFERLADPVTHERTFTFDRRSGQLAIGDRLIGRGRHQAVWHFHLAPGVRADPVEDRLVSLCADGRRWIFRVPAGMALVIAGAEYSPSYGVTVPCMAINLSVDVDLAGEQQYDFSIAMS